MGSKLGSSQAWGKNVLGRGYGKCKGPEVGIGWQIQGVARRPGSQVQAASFESAHLPWAVLLPERLLGLLGTDLVQPWRLRGPQ